MNKPKFKPCEFVFAPQVDVEMPIVELKETVCQIDSYGAVYDLTLRCTHEFDNYFTTTLTEEELSVLNHYISFLLEKRAKDPVRQTNKKEQ
jgi:hypothetical protein